MNPLLKRMGDDVARLDTASRIAARDARRAIEGDEVIADPRRLILRSPNGHFWSVVVDDTGLLGTVDLGTDPPA